MLRFVAISGCMNFIKKETLKVLKYKRQIIEMEHKCKLKQNWYQWQEDDWNHIKIVTNIWKTYVEVLTSRDYKKQTYWALHTRTDIEVTKGLSWKIRLHVPYMVNTE